MSTQLSPDGLWWWNGSQWVSALSPDGRWRWNGTQWLLNEHRPVPIERSYVLAPSMETKPLQAAVVAFLVISALLNVWVMSTGEGTMLRNLPSFQSDSAAGQASLNGIVNVSIVAGITVSILWNALLAVGAWLRWRWVYYVFMVFGLLAAIGVVTNVFVLALNSQSDTAVMSFVTVMSGLAYFGLSIWMFRLWRERGTAWAMRHLPVAAAAEPGH